MATGGVWIYAGVSNLFPRHLKKHFQRAYYGAHLSGKRFNAAMNQDGFEIAETSCSWRVQWQSVQIKSEDENVFLLCSYGSMFIFGKRYLSDEQQHELRAFSGLKSP
jgi:predicted HD phosphohydrolase